MSKSRMEEIDFERRLPVVRLVLACLVFGVLGWAFANDKWSEYKFTGLLTPADILELVGVGLVLVLSFLFIVLFLLLPFRLKFTDAGIRRLTVFGPWFVAWNNVRAAHVGTYRGYLALELRVSQWRWVCVPLLEYRKGGDLLDEIRSRLPVELKVTERQVSILNNR